MRLDRGNVIAVARREYYARGRTRTFKITTILLIVVGVAAALSPLIFRWIDEGIGQTTIEVSVGDSKPGLDVVATLSAVLNAGPGATAGTGTGAGAGTGSGEADSKPRYRVVATDDIEAARTRVLDGASDGVLVVTRSAAGDLAFDYVTKHSARDRIAQVLYQASATIAVQDRLASAGIPPAQQAALFAPPAYDVSPADPNAPPTAGDEIGAEFAIGFVLAILLFMAIVLYGQWVAYSVAEEKSSRVMELILGAATPFELLAGKVAGVGALAMTQYLIVAAGAVVALVFQDQIAALIFGGTAGTIGFPNGLSIPLLLGFGVFFILGFLIYAALYAGAAALVSRTEDINQIVAPMTLLSSAGYIVAVYSTTGVLDANAPFVVALSDVPFFSPDRLVSRLGSGLAGPVEALVAIAILVVTIPVVLWVAARFYAAGVLMYGQRPSMRLMLRVLRSGAR
jgi:ABC-2 type transport system permease protein